MMPTSTAPRPRRIALFGGSFDPPHLGHLEIARAAYQQANLDGVIFLPCAISPHKSDTPPTSGEHRLAMLEQLTTDSPWASVSDLDLKLPPPSLTWRTVEHIKTTDTQETQLFWILGADQWNQLHRWAEPERLRESLHFLVFPRDGEMLETRVNWTSTTLQANHAASSSKIRRAIHSGRWDEISPWLPDVVVRYIQSNDLYL